MARLGIVVALLAALVPHAIAADHDLKQLTDESRRVADSLAMQVRAEILKSLESSGPLRALAVSKYGIPEMTSAVSRQTGWKVSMVSLKPRNPALAMPDEWERRVLAEFEARVQRGEKAEGLEHFETVAEGETRYFRYMKAMALSKACLACHGMPDQVPAAVRAQIAAAYPHDRAMGYREGQVRGAVTVKRPL